MPNLSTIKLRIPGLLFFLRHEPKLLPLVFRLAIKHRRSPEHVAVVAIAHVILPYTFQELSRNWAESITLLETLLHAKPNDD